MNERTPLPLPSLMTNQYQELLGEPEQYSHIELTEEETKEALRIARQAKQVRLNIEAYNEKLKRPNDWLKPTAEELFEMISNARTFKGQLFDMLPVEQKEDESDEDFEKRKKKKERYIKQVKNLCCYFAGDHRFKGKLDRGLALLGNPGTGKTALMKFFGANQIFSYRVKSMLEITADYKKDGESAVMIYNANVQGTRNDYGHVDFGYCFDDVGMEEVPAKHYAETKNVFAEIVAMRDLSTPMHSTHFTSNVDAKKLEELYGSRVYDRMKDMFNIIDFYGLESFRGKK